MVLGGEFRRKQVGVHLPHNFLGPETEVTREVLVDRYPPEIPVLHQDLLRNIFDQRLVSGFALTQFLLSPLQRFYVRIRAKPPDYLAFAVAERNRARLEPSINAVLSAKAKFDIEWLV